MVMSHAMWLIIKLTCFSEECINQIQSEPFSKLCIGMKKEITDLEIGKDR